jgi:hypothetical protein
MWSLLKFLIFLALIAMFLWFGTHVKMGKYTLFGHVQRIWHTEEAQDLVRGVREGSGPAVDKMKRGVKAGVEEATKPEPADAGVATVKPEAQPAREPHADAGPKKKKSRKKPATTGI